jgi:hypothetical protein
MVLKWGLLSFLEQPLRVPCPFALFREDTLDETEVMRRQMNPMAGNPTFDANAAFTAEKNAYAQVDEVQIRLT